MGLAWFRTQIEILTHYKTFIIQSEELELAMLLLASPQATAQYATESWGGAWEQGRRTHLFMTGFNSFKFQPRAT